MMRVLKQVGLCLVVLAAGCEVRSTDAWLPGGEKEKAQQPVPAVSAEEVDTSPKTPSWRPLEVWNLATGDAVGVAVGVTPKTAVAVLSGQPADKLGLVDGDGVVVEVTAVTPHAGWWRLTLTSQLPPPTVGGNARVDALRIGDDVIRVAWSALGREQERLTVVAAAGDTVATTCPRRPAGILVAPTGAWLPARWQPDPGGACARIAGAATPVTSYAE